MNRFIKELVVPEQSNIRGNYLTGNHLIDKIRNSNELECQPKTIQRFIKYGWPVNAQILDKFWDMVKNWDRNGQEQWWRWGLPKYMVDAFSESVNRPQLVAIKKRNKKEGFGGRPHLSFDFESEFPMLIIPPQETCRDSHLEICHCPLDAPQQELSETTKISSVYIDGKYYSDNRNDSVYPSNFWRVQVLGNDFMSVRYDFPVGDDGNAVPFYLFNSETSKLIGNFPENCPKEIIIVYPKQSDFDLDGGTRLTEAIPLYHKWKAWQYVICELEEEESVSFFYEGLNACLTGQIYETISFRWQTSKQNRVQLAGESVGPSWIRCADDRPIITDYKDVQFVFTQRGYMSGELICLDSDDQTRGRFFKLEFQKTGHGFSATFPDMNIRPGTYKVHFRGAIGLDDLTLNFVFLPINEHRRIFSADHPLIADSFRIGFSQQILFEPIDNTDVSMSESKVLDISLKEDNGDAFCALKLFPNSLRPIILLLARSDIRWVRHSEEEHIDWCFWRSRNEDITVQRMDELDRENLLALVEIDHISELLSKKLQKNKNKLRLLFENTTDNTRISLMSDEVRNYKRNSRIWIVRLDKFSDQLKSSLRGIESGSLRFDDYGGQERPVLFTLLRKPEFKDFKVRSVRTDKDSETLNVTWTPHPNEPRKNRVLNFYASDDPAKSIRKNIKDGEQPPVKIKLNPPGKPEIWVAEIDVQKSRFGFNRFADKTSKPQSKWMRISSGWMDWLEWPDIQADDIMTQTPFSENLAHEDNITSWPWCYFLYLFYHGDSQHLHRELRTISGDHIIRKALPFSSGNIWYARDPSRTCLSLKIKPSTIEHKDFSCFQNCKPFQWGQVPEGIEIELCMNTSHRYLGESGTIWCCCREKGNMAPVMKSDSEKFSLSAWLMSAVSPSEKGSVVAQLPIERLWDNPPLLPILGKLPRKDSFFIQEEKKDQVVKHNKDLNTDSPLKIALAESLSKKKDSLSVSPEDNKRAFSLVERWKRWSEGSEVNSLLRRMISGRSEYSPVQIITGAAAFIIRLKANGYEHSIFKNKSDDQHFGKLKKLLDDTLDFIHDFLPQAFLRDLILSELIISWYWNKRLYQSSKDKSSARELERLQDRQKRKIPEPISSPKSAQSTEKIEHPGKIVGSLPVKTGKNRIHSTHLYEQNLKNIWSGPFTNNDFIDNGYNTVTDRVTGLMWQKRGSPKPIKLAQVKTYIEKLNDECFAGYSDWRVPSLEELGTLLTHNKESRNKGLFAYFIDPIFCQKKTSFWASDVLFQYISFYSGSVKYGNDRLKNYVRAVRSEPSTT
ncbi:DUF1566 domain-containing protein [Desulfonema magnum]|uniref:Lcl C-terminal domain-containing protein n=1 Tax=Desulfonema magnum TaxID=45655 RepID=UPI001A9B6A95|nr:DUF1566 domain-containing protein [Desulfonema magnum]